MATLCMHALVIIVLCNSPILTNEKDKKLRHSFNDVMFLWSHWPIHILSAFSELSSDQQSTVMFTCIVEISHFVCESHEAL